MNILLVLLHSGDVVGEGALLVPAGGGEEPQEAGQLLPVGRVFVDAKLQVLAELLIELLEVVLVLADLLKQLHHLLDPVLPYDLEDLVLLEHLPGDVKGHVLAVHDALDEVEVLWDDLLAVFISYWCCSIYAAPMGPWSHAPLLVEHHHPLHLLGALVSELTPQCGQRWRVGFWQEGLGKRL